MDALFPNGISHYLAGGLVMGAGVALLYVLTGCVGGMSAVFSSAWSYVSSSPFFRQQRFVESREWRLVLAGGLVLGAAAFVLLKGGEAAFVTQVPWWRLLAGGVLVGFGARMSGGCTSGHGICGLASLQLPSLLAVLTFLAVGIAVAHAVTALGVAP